MQVMLLQLVSLTHCLNTNSFGIQREHVMALAQNVHEFKHLSEKVSAAEINPAIRLSSDFLLLIIASRQNYFLEMWS